LARRLAESRLARQFGGLTSGRAAAAALSFVWLAVAARHLSVPQFADLALVLTVGAIMSAVADAGLAIVLNEASAAEPPRARATLLLVIGRRLLLAVGAALAMAAFYLLAATDTSPAVPAVFAVSMLATAFHTSCAAALRGAVSVVPDALNEAASRALVLLLGAFLLVNGGGLLAAVATYAAADVASALVLGLVAWRRLSPERPADRSRLRLRRVLPLGLAAVAGVVYYRIDLWLLAVLTDATEVAQYSVSYRIVDFLIMPAGALAVVMIGSTARLDHRSAVAKADRMARMLCLGVLPAVAVILAVPGLLLQLGFGADYGPGGDVLRILALAVPPSVAALAWAPLVALRQNGLLSVTVSCLVANVALNLVLIPHIGAAGAGVATVAGQTMFAGLLRLKLRSLLAEAVEPVSEAALMPVGEP
jgi:O-antigen/teichoic acid export membrane protein